MSLLDLSIATFGPQAEIQPKPMALNFPENLPKSKWIECGRMLPEMLMAARWWAGDWIAYGMRTYGPEVRELQEVREIEKQLEFDVITTASCVREPQRRQGLPWSAHREVAELAEDKQEEWLGKMESKGWDVVQLRREIRHAFASAPIKGNSFTWQSPTKAVREVVTWLKNAPESYWVPQTRELWKKELKPIVEFWEGL